MKEPKIDKSLSAETLSWKALADRCTQIADRIVPEYRGGKKGYACTGVVAKRWQAAWDGACVALGASPDDYRLSPEGRTK